MATLLAWSCALNFHSWNESMIFWLPDPLPMWQESQSGKPVSPRLRCTPNVYLVRWSIDSFIWGQLLLCENAVLSLLRWYPLTSVVFWNNIYFKNKIHLWVKSKVRVLDDLGELNHPWGVSQHLVTFLAEFWMCKFMPVPAHWKLKMK